MGSYKQFQWCKPISCELYINVRFCDKNNFLTRVCNIKKTGFKISEKIKYNRKHEKKYICLFTRKQNCSIT